MQDPKMPKIVRLRSDLEKIGCKHYRLTGGVITAEWLESHTRFIQNSRHGMYEEPYCDISVWHDGETLGSYSGTVWPSAWPSLFQCHRGSAQSGPYTTITPLALDLLEQADLEAP
jgi:hypothetical protein